MDNYVETPTIEKLLSSYSDTFTDLGNARRFIARHGHNLRYVSQWGWLIWDGKRWTQDDPAGVHPLARETILSLYNEAAALPEDQHKDCRTILKHARSSLAPRHLRTLLELARTDPAITALPSTFDRNPFLLNVNNGTLDLRTGTLQPHDSRDFITHLIPIDYQPHAFSPLWERFLSEITDHTPPLQQYLQRAVGYSLSGSIREEAFFLLHGLGRNGKSRFLEALSSVLGDYVQYTPASTFMRKNATAQPFPLPASLATARFIIATETAPEQTLDSSTIKLITSGETVTICTSSRTRIPCKPQFKLWMATNHLPKIPEHTPAIWQRLKLIHFPVSFIGRENRDLSTQLADAAPAILAWAVQGSLLWHQQGLQEPECILLNTEHYQQDQDELADFLLSCCQFSPDHHVKARDLYLAYTHWCHHHRQTPLSETSFAGLILAHGYRRERRKKGKVYYGLSLHQEDMPLLSPSEHPYPAQHDHLEPSYRQDHPSPEEM